MQNHLKTREPPWTILKLLKWTTSYFKSHKLENPRASAEMLLSYALKLRRIDLYVQYDQPLVKDELAAFKSLIKRRIKREPIAYIVGEKEFWSMPFKVTKDVLIPRPETECLVEAALLFLKSSEQPKRILELGTGSGAVIIALASEVSGNVFFASDKSKNAIQVSQENAVNNILKNSICFFCGHWFEPLKKGAKLFDMIISNPPYIKTDVISQLEPEIYDYEPWLALDGDKDGLKAVRHIIYSASYYLAEKGFLLLEIGHDQKNDVYNIIKDSGFYDNVDFAKDYSGKDRVVCMRKKQ